MSNIIISRVTSTAPQYQQVWDLREEVLRKPLGMSLKNEDLSGDAIDQIFIAQDAGKVIGCLMLKHVDADTIKFRQMAVSDAHQGRNIGRMLMDAAEQYAATEGYKQVSLHARMVAAGFYSRLGYMPKGDEFTEVGIPHVLMEKRVG